MNKELAPYQSEFILYTGQNGDVRISVLLQNETVWLTQKGLSNLFGVDRSVITMHLQNIFSDEGLSDAFAYNHKGVIEFYLNSKIAYSAHL